MIFVRIFKKKYGLDKVKFWVIILMILLSACLGIHIGASWPKQIAVPETAANDFYDIGLLFWNFFQNTFSKNKVAAWTTVAIGFILACVLEFLCLRHRPNKRPSTIKPWEPTLENIQVLVYLLTAVFFGLSAWYDSNITRLLSVCLGILTIATVVELIKVLQDVYVKRNSEDYVYFEQHKKSVLLKTTGIGLLLVGLPLWIPNYWGFTLPQLMVGRDLLGYYTALLSLTFISISVMSVLSDRTVVIYWENIAEGKLIKPVFGSFAAYTYYSIGAAMGAGICVALGNGTAFIVFCTINIATMILLTYTMVDVYYDRESKKLSRAKELREDTADYLWVRKAATLSGEALDTHYQNKETKEKYTPREIKGKHIGHDRYEEKMLLLCQNIRRANDEHDLMYLREVYELYQENLTCFNTPDGKRVVQMLFVSCAAETWPLLIRSIRAHLADMSQNQLHEEDPFSGDTWWENNWNQDEPLWVALAESDYLRTWLKAVSNDPLDTQDLLDFIYLVTQRLVLLYNDMVTHYNCEDENKCDYLTVSLRDCAVWIETAQGQKPDPAQIARVFNSLFGKLVVESTFAARLMRVLYVMLENLQENGLETFKIYLSAFPLPAQFTPFMTPLGFEDPEIALWKEYFPAK